MAKIHDDLREVMGLLGKATPGPWYSEMGASRQRHVRGKSRNVNRAPARIATLGSPRAYQSDVEIEDEANARLIVAAVNLLKEHGPALLARQEGEDCREVKCSSCGKPTMHLGPLCFSCTKARSAARSGGGG